MSWNTSLIINKKVGNPYNIDMSYNQDVFIGGNLEVLGNLTAELNLRTNYYDNSLFPSFDVNYPYSSPFMNYDIVNPDTTTNIKISVPPATTNNYLKIVVSIDKTTSGPLSSIVLSAFTDNLFLNPDNIIKSNVPYYQTYNSSTATIFHQTVPMKAIIYIEVIGGFIFVNYNQYT